MTVETPTVQVVSALSADMREMISELNALLLSLSPPEACYHMTAEEMADGATTVFAVRLYGTLAACGALHRHEKGIAEVKRMYTRPGFQGQGLGGLILGEIVARAKNENFHELVLETGDRHPAAWRIYERAGFSRCGPVLDYPDSPYSVFYSKPLVADQETSS